MPTAKTKLAGSGRLPYQVPVSDTLFSSETNASAYDFIANASLNSAWRLRYGRQWRAGSIDPCNLELSGHDPGEDAQRGLPLPKKAVAAERLLVGKPVLPNLQHRTGTHDSRLRGVKRCTREIRRESFRNRLSFQRGSQQTGAPLRKNARDLVGILFSDEVIEPRLHLPKRAIQRPLGPIMRVKLKSPADVWFVEPSG